MSLNVSKTIKSSPYSLLFIVFSILCLGLISLFSVADSRSVDDSNAFLRQLIFLGPAIILMFLFIIIPKKIIHEYVYIFYGAVVLFVVLPYFSAKVADTHRWIDIGLPFSLQPSEIAKLVIVLTLARYLSDRNIQLDNFGANFIPFLIAFLPAMIVLNQPDLGTALVMMSPVIPMLYWVGARPFHLFLVIAPVLSIITAFDVSVFTSWTIIMAVIIFLSKPQLWSGITIFFSNIFLGLVFPLFWNGFLRPYHRNRILTSINPELDPLGSGYQVIQSKTALGSGGFFGKGWGEGTQTQLKFLPVQESDFILSVIGEELGFIVILIILFTFGYLINSVIRTSYLSKDKFSSLILIGLGSILLAHVFVNTAMTVGLIPVKGLPLPFISAGGTFLITSYLMIGLIMRFSINYSD